jgi:hypothetical protein
LALAALRQDACFAEGFGQSFIDYDLRIKQFVIDRCQARGERMGAEGIFRAVLTR